ncbi:MAG: PfkB family carbohydrate kinase [Rhizobiaceae bacterium]
MSRILVAGVAVLDFVFHMKTFPRQAEKYRADGASISGGGNAANAAVAISRLDGSAYLASRLGNDQIADMIIADLEKEGVGTGLIRRHGDNRSSFSSIYIDEAGERQIMNYRDPDLPVQAAWPDDQIPDALSATLADTRWPDGALAAMKLAKQLGIPGVMDAEAPVHEAEHAVLEASHVAFSAQGVQDFTGESDIEKAAVLAYDMVPGTVLVTDGENGVVSVSNRTPQWTPAFAVKAIDTLGAGDVWHGAFALALGEGKLQAQAIEFASAAAAIKCGRTGGRDGAPNRAEVNQFLKETS